MAKPGAFENLWEWAKFKTTNFSPKTTLVDVPPAHPLPGVNAGVVGVEKRFRYHRRYGNRLQNQVHSAM